MPDYKKFFEYWHDLYGTGLKIAGWHLNGELEDFDNFFDSAVESMDGVTIMRTFQGKTYTELWEEFGYNVQKMCSIAASMATLAFNKAFAEQTEKEDSGIDLSVYRRKFQTAMFDARAFTVPLDEVCNCLIWRQQDATRNSIEAVGQANFSQRELHGKNCNKIQDMLWKERNINWNDFPTDCKRGSCCIKTRITEAVSVLNGDATVEVSRSRWVVDREPPVFTQDREYVERRL